MKVKNDKNKTIFFMTIVVLIIAIVVMVFVLQNQKRENENINPTSTPDISIDESGKNPSKIPNVSIDESEKNPSGMPEGIPEENDINSTDASDVSILQLENNLSITRIDSYTGEFMENGTDIQVEDIMMIVVKNNGENTLQYAELILEYENGRAEFAFSTLMPEKQMLVLEKNRRKYSSKEEIMSVKLENVVFFEEEPNLHEEKFAITTMEGAFNIVNISETSIKAPIVVYYKNKKNGLYHGGITYRVVIEETMDAGEIVQVMTNHFSAKNSEIVFITYAE